MEYIGAIIGFVGVIVGGLLTYLFSIRLLQKQLRRQQAYEFISKNYLPLLGALEHISFTGYMWANTEKKENGSYTKSETLEIHDQSINQLERALSTFTESGTLLLVKGIDKNLYNYILGTNYQLMARRNKRAKSAEVQESEIFKWPNAEHIIDMKKRMEKVPIPILIAKYEQAMEKGLK